MTSSEDHFNPDTIRRALESEQFDSHDAQQKMTPRPRGLRPAEKIGRPNRGAVLLVLYKKEGVTHIVLTRRRDDLSSHPGQISFPGGRREASETLKQTALREAQEEIDLDLTQVEIIGRLSCLYIPPTDYEVFPFVSWYRGSQRFRPQDSEVAEILEVPMSHLLNPDSRFEELWEIRGDQVEVPFYLVGPYKVWGATAMMLSEFLERIKLAAG